MLNYNLKSKYYCKFDRKNPLQDYPRPTLKRDAYLCLNGEWDLAIAKINETDYVFDKKIIVPYCIESNLSGLRIDLKKDEYIVYKRIIRYLDDWKDKTVILHFDSVMQKSEIIINGLSVKTNFNGFLPFQIDITPYLKEENELIVKVYNTPDYNYGVGKEGHNRGGMWYTKTTGIYKTVWIEWLPNKCINDVKITTEPEGEIAGKIISECKDFTVTILKKDKEIMKLRSHNVFRYCIAGPEKWTPSNPVLYRVIIESETDKVETYVAFRKFSAVDEKFYLNGKEFFVNGVLYQPYFSDGLYTPSSYSAFEDDIIKMKDLGFNAVRVHVKVECEMFYYLADKIGILVLQDIPNSGKYSYLFDSVLPTIGIKWLPKNASKKREKIFIDDSKKTIDFISKHPSVVYITIFNEGWGQFKANMVYSILKNYNHKFVYDTTSGWFNVKNSDVLSIHNYFFKLKVPKSNKPVIISEFGGFSCSISGHIFNDSKEYGYKKYDNCKELSSEIIKLYDKIYDLKTNGLAGCIYTQYCDVEDETNGFVTFDRNDLKVEDNVKEKIIRLTKKFWWE